MKPDLVIDANGDVVPTQKNQGKHADHLTKVAAPMPLLRSVPLRRSRLRHLDASEASRQDRVLTRLG